MNDINRFFYIFCVLLWLLQLSYFAIICMLLLQLTFYSAQNYKKELK